ncbi:hypothetical protein MPER_11879 [Moniliophthora perniciosa FA553]|nr:hypothetical protein MPER_11879 [Moniliophthora perniciosa FA553]
MSCSISAQVSSSAECGVTGVCEGSSTTLDPIICRSQYLFAYTTCSAGSTTIVPPSQITTPASISIAPSSSSGPTPSTPPDSPITTPPPVKTPIIDSPQKHDPVQTTIVINGSVIISTLQVTSPTRTPSDNARGTSIQNQESTTLTPPPLSSLAFQNGPSSSSVITPSESNFPTIAASARNGPPAGLIAGVVVAAVMGAVVLLGAVVVAIAMRRRRKRRIEAGTLPTPYTLQSGSIRRTSKAESDEQEEHSRSNVEAGMISLAMELRRWLHFGRQRLQRLEADEPPPEYRA